MCRILVTPDRGFLELRTPETEKRLFIHSLNFIQKRYGKENIFSAVVRTDEGTSQMSVCLTPIREGRMAASKIFDYKELKDLQENFNQAVSDSLWAELKKEKLEERKRNLLIHEEKLQRKIDQLNSKRQQLIAKMNKEKRKEQYWQRVALGELVEKVFKESAEPERLMFIELAKMHLKGRHLARALAGFEQFAAVRPPA